MTMTVLSHRTVTDGRNVDQRCKPGTADVLNRAKRVSMQTRAEAEDQLTIKLKLASRWSLNPFTPAHTELTCVARRQLIRNLGAIGRHSCIGDGPRVDRRNILATQDPTAEVEPSVHIPSRIVERTELVLVEMFCGESVIDSAVQHATADSQSIILGFSPNV